MADRIRIVVATPGPDGRDDHAAEELSRALRDAGMEVVVTGPDHTPEQIVRTAVQEDVDVVGLALGSGASGALAQVAELLEQAGAQDVAVFGVATSPPGTGTATIFPAGAAAVDEIVAWVRENVPVDADA